MNGDIFLPIPATWYFGRSYVATAAPAARERLASLRPRPGRRDKSTHDDSSEDHTTPDPSTAAALAQAVSDAADLAAAARLAQARADDDVASAFRRLEPPPTPRMAIPTALSLPGAQRRRPQGAAKSGLL